jgi:hypothetical protein
MSKKRKQGLDFTIDKLTNSIENAITSDRLETTIIPLGIHDLQQIKTKNGWVFNWKKELSYPARDIYKLTIVNNSEIIQGLISLEVMQDHVYIHLIESAPFNKGKTKIYIGVPGNLIAYACKLSFQRGFDGYVSFHAKTLLIKHYIDTLGATHFGDRLMVIEGTAAIKLVNKYFRGV